MPKKRDAGHSFESRTKSAISYVFQSEPSGRAPLARGRTGTRHARSQASLPKSVPSSPEYKIPLKLRYSPYRDETPDASRSSSRYSGRGWAAVRSMVKASAAFKKQGVQAYLNRLGGKIEFPDLVAPASLPGHTVGVKELKKEAERRMRGFGKELRKIRGSIDDALLTFDQTWKDEAVGTLESGSLRASSRASSSATGRVPPSLPGSRDGRQFVGTGGSIGDGSSIDSGAGTEVQFGGGGFSVVYPPEAGSGSISATRHGLGGISSASSGRGSPSTAEEKRLPQTPLSSLGPRRKGGANTPLGGSRPGSVVSRASIADPMRSAGDNKLPVRHRQRLQRRREALEESKAQTAGALSTAVRTSMRLREDLAVAHRGLEASRERLMAEVEERLAASAAARGDHLPGTASSRASGVAVAPPVYPPGMPAKTIEELEGADLQPMDRLQQRLLSTQELEATASARRSRVTRQFLSETGQDAGSDEEGDAAMLMEATTRSTGPTDSLPGPGGEGGDRDFDDHTVTQALLSGIDVGVFQGGLDTSISTVKTAKEQLMGVFRTATHALQSSNYKMRTAFEKQAQLLQDSVAALQQQLEHQVQVAKGFSDQLDMAKYALRGVAPKVDHLREANSKLERQQHEMEVAAQKLKKEVTRARAEHRASSGELAAARRERNDMIAREKELSQAVLKLKRHVAHLQVGADDGDDGLDDDIDIGLSASEAKKLKSQLAAAREQASTHGAEATAAKSAEAAARRAVEEAEAKAASLQSRIDALELGLEQAKAGGGDQGRLQVLVKELQEQLKATKYQLKDERYRSSDLQGSLTAAQQDAEAAGSLGAELNELRKQLTEADKAKEAADKTTVELKKYLEESRRAAYELQGKIKAANAAASSQKPDAGLQEAKEQLARALTAAEELYRQATALQAREAELKSQVEELQADRDALEREVKALEARLSTADGEYSRLSEELEKERGRTTALEGELQQLRSLSVEDDKAATAAGALYSANEELSRLRSELEKSKAQSSEVDDLRRQLQEAQDRSPRKGPGKRPGPPQKPSKPEDGAGDAAASEIDGLQSKLQESTRARAALEEQLKYLRARQGEGSGGASSDEMDKLRGQLYQALEEAEEAAKAREKAIEEAGILRKSLYYMQKGGGKSAEQLQKALRALEEAEAALAQAEREKAVEEQKALEADRALQRLRHESNSLRSKYQDAESKIRKLQQVIDSVGGDASEAARAVEEAEAEKYRLSTMVTSIQRKLAYAEEAQRKAEKTAADGHASVHEMQKTITRLRTQKPPTANVLVTSLNGRMSAAAAAVVTRRRLERSMHPDARYKEADGAGSIALGSGTGGRFGSGRDVRLAEASDSARIGPGPGREDVLRAIAGESPPGSPAGSGTVTPNGWASHGAASPTHTHGKQEGTHGVKRPYAIRKETNTGGSPAAFRATGGRTGAASGYSPSKGPKGRQRADLRPHKGQSSGRRADRTGHVMFDPGHVDDSDSEGYGVSSGRGSPMIASPTLGPAAMPGISVHSLLRTKRDWGGGPDSMLQGQEFLLMRGADRQVAKTPQGVAMSMARHSGSKGGDQGDRNIGVGGEMRRYMALIAQSRSRTSLGLRRPQPGQGGRTPQPSRRLANSRPSAVTVRQSAGAPSPIAAGEGGEDPLEWALALADSASVQEELQERAALADRLLGLGGAGSGGHGDVLRRVGALLGAVEAVDESGVEMTDEEAGALQELWAGLHEWTQGYGGFALAGVGGYGGDGGDKPGYESGETVERIAGNKGDTMLDGQQERSAAGASSPQGRGTARTGDSGWSEGSGREREVELRGAGGGGYFAAFAAGSANQVGSKGSGRYSSGPRSKTLLHAAGSGSKRFGGIRAGASLASRKMMAAQEGVGRIGEGSQTEAAHDVAVPPELLKAGGRTDRFERMREHGLSRAASSESMRKKKRFPGGLKLLRDD